jgi:hypothetical protein
MWHWIGSSASGGVGFDVLVVCRLHESMGMEEVK